MKDHHQHDPKGQANHNYIADLLMEVKAERSSTHFWSAFVLFEMVFFGLLNIVIVLVAVVILHDQFHTDEFVRMQEKEGKNGKVERQRKENAETNEMMTGVKNKKRKESENEQKKTGV